MRKLVACTLLGLGACTAPTASDPADDLRMNQIQVIGSHNSYKQAPDRALLEMVASFEPSARGWDYHHPPIGRQLERGLRNLELDVYDDPDGGRYARPLGLDLVRRAGVEPTAYDPQHQMERPGFKVLHVQDVDFRSNHLTLSAALAEMTAWSRRHPMHLPVFVTVNTKDQKIPLPGSVEPLPFDAAALDRLDAAIVRHLGRDRLITPDDVRGASTSLRDAVLTRGWPSLGSVRGKFLFVLDQGGTIRNAYLQGHPRLQSRVMFVSISPDDLSAAFFVINDPVKESESIRDLVTKGFIVRTRADADTHEARVNDRTRFEAAKATGAQAITTDYYVSDESLGTGYRVCFDDESFVRLNPVTAAGVSRDGLKLESD